jgi:heme/copper-type cytochrome/quinol oxidase subunit 2
MIIFLIFFTIFILFIYKIFSSKRKYLQPPTIYYKIRRLLVQLFIKIILKIGIFFVKYNYNYHAKNFDKYEQKVFKNLIKNNENCEYGIKNNFKKLKSIDDYLKNVPITDYEEFSDYIEKMIKSSSKNLIFSEQEKVEKYLLTSGSRFFF